MLLLYRQAKRLQRQRAKIWMKRGGDFGRIAMDSNELDDRLNEIRKQALAQSVERGRLLANRFARSVLPLFIPDDAGRPARLGSCVLVMVDGHPFAFTAGHAIMEAGDSLLHVGTGPKGKLRPLPCPKGFRSPEPKGGLDFDVGILPLSKSRLAPFSAWSFFRASDVDENDRPNHLAFGQNSYFVFGYSASRSQVKVHHQRRHIDQSTFQFTGLPEPPATYIRESRDPAMHLILEFDHTDIRVAGQRMTPPKLQGVSGGGMFHLADLSPTTQAKLVAVATDHDKKARVLVGTRIEHFMDSTRRILREEPRLFE